MLGTFSWLPVHQFMFGVRFCAVETRKMEWRCASVRRLLCGFLLIFITQKNCSHRYVLPNMQSIWESCRQSCCRDEAWKLVLLHWRSISSIRRFTGALSMSTANGALDRSNFNFWAATLENRRVNYVPSVPSLSTNVQSGERWKHVLSLFGNTQSDWSSPAASELPTGAALLGKLSRHHTCQPCPWSTVICFVMSHKKTPDHIATFRPRAPWCLSLPLSRNWQISSYNSISLLSAFARLSHRTSVWWGSVPCSQSISPRKDRHWLWFN